MSGMALMPRSTRPSIRQSTRTTIPDRQKHNGLNNRQKQRFQRIDHLRHRIAGRRTDGIDRLLLDRLRQKGQRMDCLGRISAGLFQRVSHNIGNVAGNIFIINAAGPNAGAVSAADNARHGADKAHQSGGKTAAAAGLDAPSASTKKNHIINNANILCHNSTILSHAAQHHSCGAFEPLPCGK